MAPFKSSVRVEGLKELEKTLATLSKGIARNALRKAMAKAGEPIRDKAQSLAPRDTGELETSIEISTKVKNTVGNAEYAAAMRAGLGVQAARSALRDARRTTKGSFAEVYVGPSQADNKKDAIKRIVQEFGSVNQPAQPYMRPAWASEQDNALEIAKRELAVEVNKAAQRAAKRAAKLASAKAKVR